MAVKTKTKKKIPSQQGNTKWPKIARSKARRTAARVRAQGEGFFAGKEGTPEV